MKLEMRLRLAREPFAVKIRKVAQLSRLGKILSPPTKIAAREMMKRLLVTCLLLTTLFACKLQSNTSIDIAFLNETTNDLDFAEITFGENTCSAWGLVPNALAVTLDYRYPIVEEAKVRWKSAEGVVKIKELTLKGIVPPNSSGRITFAIKEDRVAATFTKK